ncbi:hypothetical protein HII31_00726 [Pseudocercospora fuligena]|uniref:F-box domain-containing protein n=1 Tax=Pseudocercospora fuligena TaxID=685502 RepID=A0A8H6VPQ9_9PEZI|nr:hypothetical protein HII31_00726 [Pseudocercospora fuligena]
MSRLTEKLRSLRQWSCLDGPPQTESNFREIAPTVVPRAKARTQGELRERGVSIFKPRENASDRSDGNMPKTVQQTSVLLRLPRELRDIILGYIIEDEPRPYLLSGKDNEPRDHFIDFTSGCALVCRQLCTEYRELLDKSAALPVIYEFEAFREPINAVAATIYNVKFKRVMAYILGLPEEKRKAFSDPNKLRISLVFTSLYETRRANLLKWLEFCKQHSITAIYRAPNGAWPDYKPMLFINIYDLFGLPGGSEEEKIFTALQKWYATRQEGGGRRVVFCWGGYNPYNPYAREVQREQDQGLRKAKTFEQNHQPVRLAED